jgi:hypothetical protein
LSSYASQPLIQLLPLLLLLLPLCTAESAQGEAAALRQLLEQEKQLRDRNSLLVGAGQAAAAAAAAGRCWQLRAAQQLFWQAATAGGQLKRQTQCC